MINGTTTFSPGGSVAKDRWSENTADDGRDDVDEMVAVRLARGRDATRMNDSMVVTVVALATIKIFTYEWVLWRPH